MNFAKKQVRNEKEIKDMIIKLKSEFLENVGSLQYSLRTLKIRINVLKWCLGEDWKELKVTTKKMGLGEGR
jgi:hypothetical protein